MSKSKSMIIPQTAPNVSSGILSSFKDLMGIRKHDPPMISVCEPILKSGHHEYKVKGRDHIAEFEVIFCSFNLSFAMRTGASPSTQFIDLGKDEQEEESKDGHDIETLKAYPTLHR